ncbi:hypothetical protein ABKN59_009134 [Abortiporus biennis]
MDQKTNIRDNLEDALKTKLDFSGSISYHKEYPDAPNPALQREGLGAIGVPLSTREAQEIRSKANQAPFGMGERTLVDKSVRDTWEMDAKSVTFANPRWHRFMMEVVNEVCQSLGVSLIASTPRCELYKLLLYETGSHFLPHVDTEKVNGMFATIIVVLPSEFTGGQAHLSHGFISEIYDCSPKSSYQTSVMAWYTDVMHEIKPIQSGYRLALSYNLIHTTNMLRPALSTNSAFINQVSAVFKQWKEAGDAGPDKLVYLLSHKYSQVNLQSSALKGADDIKIALLSSVAKETGFQLGLASVECHLVGSAADNGDYGRRRGRYGCYYDEDDEDDDDVEFEEIHEREMSIQDFVDMDGSLISDNLTVHDQRETIPAGLTKMVESGPHDEQEYEGYMGNVRYRRTVLVIWPDTNNYKVRYTGKQGFKYACKILFKTTTFGTEKEDQDLANFVLSGHKSTPPRNAADITKAVCTAALTWDDCALWNRAVEAGCPEKGLTIVENDNIINALDLFTFPRIQRSLELLVQNTQSNSRRFGFLDTMKTCVNNEAPEVSDADLLSWIKNQTQLCLQSMKKPEKTEVSLLTSLIAVYGVPTFRDVILPQIRDQVEPDFLAELAVAASKATPIVESNDKTALISNLVQAAISKLTLRTLNPAPQPVGYGYYNQTQPKPAQVDPNLQTAKQYIAICLSLNLVQHLGELFEKATDISGMSESDVQARLKDFMLPLITYVQSVKLPDDLATNQLPRMAELAKKTTELYLATIARPRSSMSAQDGQNFINTVIAGGGWDLLQSTVLPKVDTLSLSSGGLLVPNTPSQRKYTKPEEIQALLTGCIKAQALPSVKLYLSRIAHANNKQDYIKNTLIPLIPRLRELGLKYNMLDTFASTFQFIIAAWVSKCLGSKPTDDGSAIVASISRKWDCSCLHCATAKRFLLQPPVVGTPSVNLSHIGAPKRKHVESQLTSSGASGISDWQMISGSPQGLRITLNSLRYKPAIWKRDQGLGLGYLKQISTDEDELRRLLGQVYAQIVNTLRGTTNARNAPQVAGPSATGSSNAATRKLPGQGAEGPPAKKQKTTSGPIIDLTID